MVCDPGLSNRIARVFLADHLRDAVTDQWVEISGRNSEALEHGFAELAARTVDAVRNQELVARGQQAQQGRCVAARPEENNAVPPRLARIRKCFGQRPVRGRTLKPVAICAERRAALFQFRDAVEEDRRSVRRED